MGWEEDGAWTYIVPDALDSVRQETDAHGAVVAVREWTPYGIELSAARDGLGYAGEWYDPNLGLQYLRARWYDAHSGTFVARDPIADNHPYRYANGNPITYSDPSGLDVGCPGRDASKCGTESSPLYALGVAACRDQGMSGGCYLWEGASWYVYFTGSQQGASEYIYGTGLAAGEEGRYRVAVAQEWSGYAYGKEWINAPENLRFWPNSQRPSPELATFIMMSFAGPGVANLSWDMTCLSSFPATSLGEDVYPNPGLSEYPGSQIDLSVLQQRLEAEARQINNQIPGRGSVVGTSRHTALRDVIRNWGDPNVEAEVSYLGGRRVEYGTRGSVRLDVVVYDSRGDMLAVYDYKTGQAHLSASRIAQIRTHLPGQFRNIPMIEIRGK